jgi:hypothetical protein
MPRTIRQLDVTVTVTPSVARALLARAGYTRDERARWFAPDGRWYWETDEALKHALVAIAEE